MVQLSEHFSYFPCGKNDRPNIGYVVGKYGAAIIDSGNSKKNAELFLREIRKEERNQNCSLLLTHQHWDHICGAQYMEVPVYSSRSVYEKIAVMREREWTIETVKKANKQKLLCDWTCQNICGELEAGEKLKMRLPDYAIEEAMTFELGGVTCYYEPIVSCHGEGQYLVWIPEDKIVFIGDVLWPNMEGMEDSWYYSRHQFEQMKEQLLKYPADWYVESHVAPIPRDKLENWMQRMSFIVDAVLQGEGDMDKIFKLMPAKWKNATLGYEGELYQACHNCRE